MDDVYAWIDTEADGTPGTFDVGATYSDSDRDWGEEINAWTITSIEEVECTPNPT